MIYLTNFADAKFKPSQKFNSRTAIKIGGVNYAFEYGPESIDSVFYSKHQKILDLPRGCGYWLWKPYIILDALNKIKLNDVLIYSDSGSHFINKATPLSTLPNDFNQDIVPFELELPEAHWTKRDAFVRMEADTLNFAKSNQRLASFIVIKKSNFAIEFINDYLSYCCDPLIITDSPNETVLPNYEGFKEHRHDQSVLSLLTKKYNLMAFRDPSQWGNSRIGEFENSNYPQILEHTRHKNPKHAKLSYKIKRFFFPKK